MIEDNIDLKAQRESMIDNQLKPRGIADERVLAAFAKVPRHKFLDDKYAQQAYNDFPLPIGSEQTISQPYMVALMTDLLELKPTDKVLEIGTGSGYQTAILAELASRVYSVERISDLAEKARHQLGSQGYRNIVISIDDGSCGLAEHKPYDAILVTCGAPSLPEPLKDQLVEGGRLVVPIGDDFSQKLTVCKKNKGGLETKESCSCIFVPLIGKYGWDAQ